MQLLFSFDQDTRVEKTLIQTLACQLSSTLVQLLFSFDQDTRVEKTLIQTLACQLSSTLMQLLFSFDQDIRVEKTLIQTLACQLSCNSCSRLTKTRKLRNSHTISRSLVLIWLELNQTLPLFAGKSDCVSKLLTFKEYNSAKNTNRSAWSISPVSGFGLTFLK